MSAMLAEPLATDPLARIAEELAVLRDAVPALGDREVEDRLRAVERPCMLRFRA